MAEFTKEQLIEKLERRLAVTTHYPDFEEAQLDAQIFKIALEALTAGMEQEPVAWLLSGGGAKNNVSFDSGNAYADPLREVTPLYTAPPAPIALEAIENAIEYIRSIAFHIDEDDYHGKHIAYFMRQALAWLEGHSCSDDRLGKADNQPVRGNQAAESNRGNEWTGNPDIDNAIIMLDRIDTAESYDDDRIEAVKAVLRRLAGNSPVTPDGWISCSERMPPQDDWILIYSKHGEYMAGQVQGEYVELSDGTLSWLWNALFWMPLPEPPQEAK